MQTLSTATSGASVNYARAGFWRRFGAALIDGLIFGVVRVVLAFIVGANAAAGLSLIGSAAYFVYFHGTTGQTPGDAALSIRVVDEGGGRVSYGRALGRWAMSFVSGFVLLIGYLWMIWDSEKQTWHDKVARTYVVPA
jgi:uncharacterized RDD family membrane protein YckC